MTGRGGAHARGGGVHRPPEGAVEEWPNLVNVVLSWSLVDVMNEGLFKDKVGLGAPPEIRSVIALLGISR
jgi:hypothetical protein